MRRVAAPLAVVVLLLCAGAGFGTWLLIRPDKAKLPEISVYSHRHLTRVGPYFYCNVFNLNDCQTPEVVGQLAANEHYPVQLSVPERISRAPWVLQQVYGDPANAISTVFRPGTRLAVTIPTVDPQHGRLTQVVVQLPTFVVDQAGELREASHAEWSVRLDY
jgi:hypothetical protein